jgi:hypothetical protein
MSSTSACRQSQAQDYRLWVGQDTLWGHQTPFSEGEESRSSRRSLDCTGHVSKDPILSMLPQDLLTLPKSLSSLADVTNTHACQ